MNPVLLVAVLAAAILGIAVGAAVIYLVTRNRQPAGPVIDEAALRAQIQSDVEASLKERLLEAKEEAVRIRTEAEKEAREHYVAGQKLFDQARYTEAVVEFGNEHPDILPPMMAAKAVSVIEAHQQSFRRAVAAGRPGDCLRRDVRAPGFVDCVGREVDSAADSSGRCNSWRF